MSWSSCAPSVTCKIGILPNWAAKSALDPLEESQPVAALSMASRSPGFAPARTSNSSGAMSIESFLELSDSVRPGESLLRQGIVSIARKCFCSKDATT